MTRFMVAGVIALTLILSACESETTDTTPNQNGIPTPIGTPVGAPSSKAIGPAGGSLLSPDGRLEVIIPPGALTAETTITIQPGTNECPLGAGLGFSLLPHGQTFSVPVTLRFHYDSSDFVGSSPELLRVATQKDDRIWYEFETSSLDTISGTLSITTPHFSWYNLETQVLCFAQQDIRVNRTSTLIINSALYGSKMPDGTKVLITKEIFEDSAEIKWTLNGKSPAPITDGTLLSYTGRATNLYTAPASISQMSQNPVIVFASYNGGPGKIRFYFPIFITVSDEAGIMGTITMTASIDGSAIRENGGTEETQTETGSGSYSFVLPKGYIINSGNMRTVSWNANPFEINADRLSHYIKRFKCDTTYVTDHEILYRQFKTEGKPLTSSSIYLSVKNDGSYTLTIAAPVTETTKQIRTVIRGCPEATPPPDSSPAPIPFFEYLAYGQNGHLGAHVGTTTTPDHIAGSESGIDSSQTYWGQIIPIHYSISWDIDLK